MPGPVCRPTHAPCVNRQSGPSAQAGHTLTTGLLSTIPTHVMTWASPRRSVKSLRRTPTGNRPHRFRHSLRLYVHRSCLGSHTAIRRVIHPSHPIGGIHFHWHGIRGHQNCSLPGGSDVAGPWPDTPRFSDFPFGNCLPKTCNQPLPQKCSQLRPHFPRFPPVSGSKQPQASLLGTDANPCTRVKHQNQPQRRLRRVPDGLTRPLGGLVQPPKIACSHVAAMWLR